MNLVGEHRRTPRNDVFFTPRSVVKPPRESLAWVDVIQPLMQRRGSIIYWLTDMTLAKDEVNEPSWPRSH